MTTREELAARLLSLADDDPGPEGMPPEDGRVLREAAALLVAPERPEDTVGTGVSGVRSETPCVYAEAAPERPALDREALRDELFWSLRALISRAAVSDAALPSAVDGLLDSDWLARLAAGKEGR